MLNQLVGVIGAVLVLSAYLGLQRRWIRTDERIYHALNFGGASLLAWVAVVDRQWGFILLEGVWALAALPGLLRPRTAAEQ